MSDNKNIGYLSFEVNIDCPKCNATIDIADIDDYELIKQLSLALFGSDEKKSQWHDLKIEIICPFCENEFFLNEIEY